MRGPAATAVLAALALLHTLGYSQPHSCGPLPTMATPVADPDAMDIDPFEPDLELNRPAELVTVRWVLPSSWRHPI